MDRRLSFEYGRAIIASRALFLAVVVVLVGVTVAAAPTFAALPAALLGVVLAAYLVVFAVSPFLTQHWLTRSRLVLRQGWYFRAVIPFSEIDAVEAADAIGRGRVPLGVHRPLGQPALFVTAARTNLVSVRLRQPRRFWQAFGLQASEIIFDVNDRLRFLAAVGERRALFAPVQAHGPDPELRD